MNDQTRKAMLNLLYALWSATKDDLWKEKIMDLINALNGDETIL